MTITTEQIEARRKTIGGSDIGAILGENNYKTAYEVWEEKVEGKSIDLSKNKSVIIGNLLEDYLIIFYEKKYNNLCVKPIETFKHKHYDFLTANLDAISINDNDNIKTILEIKTASTFNKDDWGPSGSQIVPKQYYAQIAHYMLVTGYKQAHIFVGFITDSITSDILCELNVALQDNKAPDFSEIIDKMETRLYTFYKDEELEELILNSSIEFYTKYMEPFIELGIKNPPPMDFSNKYFRNCIKNKYSISEGKEIKLPSNFIQIKENYLSAINQSKIYDKIAQEEKSKIIEAMQNNEKATLDDGWFFLRKTIKRKASMIKESEYIKFEIKSPKEANIGEV